MTRSGLWETQPDSRIPSVFPDGFPSNSHALTQSEAARTSFRISSQSRKAAMHTSAPAGTARGRWPSTRYWITSSVRAWGRGRWLRGAGTGPMLSSPWIACPGAPWRAPTSCTPAPANAVDACRRARSTARRAARGARLRRARRSDRVRRQFATRAEAQQELDKFREELRNPKPAVPTLTFGAAVDRVIDLKARKSAHTQRDYKRIGKALKAEFGADTPIAAISAARIAEWEGRRLTATRTIGKGDNAIVRPLALGRSTGRERSCGTYSGRFRSGARWQRFRRSGPIESPVDSVG